MTPVSNVRRLRRPLELAEDAAAELADLFRLLGDASRLKVVAACLAGPCSVSEIAERADLSVSLASHHLRLLRAARIVRAARQGRQVFYEAQDEHVRRVIEDMMAHVGEPREED
ncbi:MAG TPA: metalloregulator ArsR/SmtB family transcription factor [Burkholderiales bacterium]|nr:metalloregulator ArsR/SmtB family transcription factor [Burkholderiales bacterium]